MASIPPKTNSSLRIGLSRRQSKLTSTLRSPTASKMKQHRSFQQSPTLRSTAFHRKFFEQEQQPEERQRQTQQMFSKTKMIEKKNDYKHEQSTSTLMNAVRLNSSSVESIDKISKLMVQSRTAKIQSRVGNSHDSATVHKLSVGLIGKEKQDQTIHETQIDAYDGSAQLSTLQHIQSMTEHNSSRQCIKNESSCVFMPGASSYHPNNGQSQSPEGCGVKRSDTYQLQGISQANDYSDYDLKTKSVTRTQHPQTVTHIHTMKINQSQNKSHNKLENWAKNQSKSTINEDLQNVCLPEEAEVVVTKQARDNPQIRQALVNKMSQNIDKLLLMTEERVARELNQRRSQSVVVQQNEVPIKKPKVKSRGILKDVRNASVILIEKPQNMSQDSLTNDEGGGVMISKHMESDFGLKKWRREDSEKEMLTTFQGRYSAGDLSHRKNKIIENTASMGPFYKKYIKQMAQSFVKDRVHRLKETLVAVQSGHIEIMTQEENDDSIQKSTEQSKYDSLLPPSLNLADRQRAQASIIRAMSTIGSPIMRLSGMELKYRIGHGDRTLDQVLQGDKRKSKSLHWTQSMDRELKLYDESVQAQAPSLHDHDMNAIKQHITINLPETERYIEAGPSTEQHINIDNEHEQTFQSDFKRNPSNQDTVFGLQIQQEPSASHIGSLAKPENPRVSIGPTRQSLIKSKDSTKEKIGQLKSLGDLHNNSLFSTMSILKDSSHLNLNLVKKASQFNVGVPRQSVDISEKAFDTPHFREVNRSIKRHKKRWHEQGFIKDKLAGKDYKQPTHRNTLSKHVWRGPATQPESVQQLIDETIKHIYGDLKLPTKKQQGYMKQRKQRLVPVDLAVLKQKAFQQFDLIRDAEKDIERTIKTKSQIKFGKEEAYTPRGQQDRKFKYSNMSSKLMPEEEKRFHEDPLKASYKDFTESQMSSSQFASEIAGTKLSFLKTKQIMAERKLCKSCVMPRSQKPGTGASTGYSVGPIAEMHATTNSMFRSTKRTFKSGEDKMNADLQNGSYHARLQHNLKITQDYGLAAGKTLKDYKLLSVEPMPKNESDLRLSQQEMQHLQYEPLVEVHQEENKPQTLEEEVLQIAARLKQQEQMSKTTSSGSFHLPPQGWQHKHYEASRSSLGGMLIDSREGERQRKTIQDRSLSTQEIVIAAQNNNNKSLGNLIQFDIDPNNVSLLEPEMVLEQQSTLVRKDTGSHVQLILTRDHNSSIYKTVEDNQVVQPAEKPIADLSTNKTTTIKEWRMVVPQSITPDLNIMDVSLGSSSRRRQETNMKIQQQANSPTKVKKSYRMRDQQVQVTNQGSSQSKLMQDDNIGVRQPQSAITSQLSGSEHAFQLPKYSIGSAFAQRASSTLAIISGEMSDERKYVLIGDHEFNGFQGSGEAKYMPQQSAQYESVLPSVIHQKQANQLKINLGGNHKTNFDSTKASKTSKSPAKTRFRVPNKLKPGMKMIKKKNAMSKSMVVTASVDKGTLNRDQTLQTSSNSSTGDVATLGKSSIDGSKFDISNQNKKMMQKNYMTTLQIRKSLQKQQPKPRPLPSENTSSAMPEVSESTVNFPKHSSQQAAQLRSWKSPFQAHLERTHAQKKMLEYNVSSQPSEVVNNSNSEERVESRGEYMTSKIVPQVVHWHDIGHPAPNSLVYNLDPFDQNSSSQAFQDSQYSMTLLQMGGQPVAPSSQEGPLPINLSPEQKQARSKKKNSCDQTEGNTGIIDSDHDYAHRNRTAEEIDKKVITPANELSPDNTFMSYSRKKNAELESGDCRLQNIHSYEKFDVKVNFTPNRDLSGESLSPSQIKHSHDNQPRKQHSLQDRVSTSQLVNALQSLEQTTILPLKQDSNEVAMNCQKNESSHPTSSQEEDNTNFIGNRKSRMMFADKGRSNNSIQRDQDGIAVTVTMRTPIDEIAINDEQNTRAAEITKPQILGVFKMKPTNN